MKSSDPVEQQRATALYFIDRLALRVGNEKGEDEADTVGCCSLRVEHLELLDNNRVTFDFLGKDSMRYQNTVEVAELVYKNLKKFMKGKKQDADLFDQLTVRFFLFNFNNIFNFTQFFFKKKIDIKFKSIFEITNGRINSKSIPYL